MRQIAAESDVQRPSPTSRRAGVQPPPAGAMSVSGSGAAAAESQAADFSHAHTHTLAVWKRKGSFLTKHDGVAGMVCNFVPGVFCAVGVVLLVVEEYIPTTMRSRQNIASLVSSVFSFGKILELVPLVIKMLDSKQRPSPLPGILSSAMAAHCWCAWMVSAPYLSLLVLLNLITLTLSYFFNFGVIFASRKHCSKRAQAAPSQTGGVGVGMGQWLGRWRWVVALGQLIQALVCLGVCLREWGAAAGNSDGLALNAFEGVLLYAFASCTLSVAIIDEHTQGYRGGMCVFLFVAHVLAVVGLYSLATHTKRAALFADLVLWWFVSELGITAGAHRLWAHRSYEASWEARLVLLVWNCIANQGSIYHWARDHRVHHRYSETDKDPHNAKRGFWYAHMGWLLLEKPAAVKEAGRQVDCSDLLADPLVRFQKSYAWINQLMCFGLPVLWAYWRYGNGWTGFVVLGALRWILVLHCTWLVNSAAHLWGSHPYSASINPAENTAVAVLSSGEGWHNWHHTYPFDYACSEYGVGRQWNPTKLVIDTMAVLGWVKGRRRATKFWHQAQVAKARRR
ncbi:unnamed protein product [Vitrella brassicaformis CCMP3155]|uniref:Fatty acid desaturase domain-containing protein n=2 Tax=Vitrella brassicaformis TaxID=1169539 RepID=A0A0G4FI04_VITBC|nr:unnamed protein product [Vitrella brassicaformis CCMP3155]|eukprot:CEM12744.1 unnamed protein product [Vitrella brassicaformis CCMP3155]